MPVKPIENLDSDLNRSIKSFYLDTYPQAAHKVTLFLANSDVTLSRPPV